MREKTRRRLDMKSARRYKWPLEKWPTEYLRAEILLLRKRVAEAQKTPTVGDAERQELVESLERAQTRARYVEAELRAAREDMAAEGLGLDEIAGKPALAKYFSTWSKFVVGMWNLAYVRQTEGWLGVLVASDRLLGYLYTLSEVPPRGDWESQAQDRLRRGIQDEAFLRVWAWGSSWSDHALIRFLRQARHAYYRPSVWAIYEKSSEMGAVDRYGGATVLK